MASNMLSSQEKPLSHQPRFHAATTPVTNPSNAELLTQATAMVNEVAIAELKRAKLLRP
ncbi:Uncharacterised protein [Vibrio cholerae]|nr:Uncharacterised protein [Vibrio cholerae]